MLVEGEHPVLRLEVYPLFVFEVEGVQAVHLLDGGVLVVDGSLPGVNDDGAVVRRDEAAVAVCLESADCAVELPRGGGAGGVVVLP